MPNVEPLRGGDPATVGPYRLVGRLGAGGHGVVYLGQARNGTPVAVKVLREGLTVDERLARAIAAARKVEPFCLAQVLDTSTSGRAYIVAEYVDGPSLQQAGRHGGAELQRIAVATATALDAIHQAGVLHGDFTPSNVLLGPDGARVVDFGLAAALGSGMKATSAIVGTPAYMAPEQLAGRPAGAAADVFSWASVMVYAATGAPPFGDDSLPAVINRILREEPRLGELPGPLREVAKACFAKDPGTRPAMRDVLLRLAAPSRRPSATYQSPRPPADDAWEHTPDRTWDAPPDRAADRAGDRAAGRAAAHPAAHPADRAADRTRDWTAPRRPARQGPGGDGAAQQNSLWSTGQHLTPHGTDPHAYQDSDPRAYQDSDPRGRQDTYEGAGQETSPLQALFDLSSPAEDHQGTPAHPGASTHPGASVHPDATAPLGAPVAAGQPLGAPVTFDATGAPADLGAHHPDLARHHDVTHHPDLARHHGDLGTLAAPVPGDMSAPLGTLVASGSPPGDGGGPVEQVPEPAPRPRGRRVKTVAIAGVSGVCVLALAGAIVWLTPTTPTPKAPQVSDTAQAPTKEPATSPSPRATRTRSTTQSEGTPSVLPTDGSSPAADRLRLVYIRPNGTRNGTCWAGGEVALQALVRRTGAPVTISYTWIIDGVSSGRSSALISENGRRYLTPPQPLRGTRGTHTVTLRITSPTPVQRSISVTLCDPNGTT